MERRQYLLILVAWVTALFPAVPGCDDKDTAKETVREPKHQEQAVPAHGDKNATMETVRKSTDQEQLARIATEARTQEVRTAAVGKLTDQTLLTKIALEDRDVGIRTAAVGKLTDLTLLTKIALEDRDVGIRTAAVGKLTDLTLLAKLAVETQDEAVGKAAVVRMYYDDLGSLERVARKARILSVRTFAAGRLPDPQLARVVLDVTDPTMLTMLTQSKGTMGELARLRLALLDPRVVSYTGTPRLSVDTKLITKGYAVTILTPFPQGGGLDSLKGYKWRIRIRDAKGAELSDTTHSPKFPRSFLAEDRPSVTTPLDIHNIIPKLLRKAMIPPSVLSEIANDDTAAPSLRRAAVTELADQTRFVTIALDMSPHNLRRFSGHRYNNREEAILELTDPVLLARIAVQDTSADARYIAVWKLTDRVLLAKIASEDKSKYVRKAAGVRLAYLRAISGTAVEPRTGPRR